MARKVILKAPVPQSLKDKVANAAAAREESEALIVREALDEYFQRRGWPTGSGGVSEPAAPYLPGEKPPPGKYPAVDALYRVVAEMDEAQRKKGTGFASRPAAANPGS